MSNDTFYIVPDTNNLFGHLNKYDIYYKGVVMSISEQKIKELMVDYVTIMENTPNRKEATMTRSEIKKLAKHNKMIRWYLEAVR